MLENSTCRTVPALTFVILATVVLTACGSSSDGSAGRAAVDAPPAKDFPSPNGRTLAELANDEAQAESDLVIAPAGRADAVGENRYGFGVFTVERASVPDAEIALYTAPGANGKAIGPFPARIESLETKPAYSGASTTEDPESSENVYVSDVEFKGKGEWRVIALVKTEDGFEATAAPSAVVGQFDQVPAEGDKAPVINTPTADEVGDLSEIDTRNPHDSMHEDNFADVVGKEPVVLLFATPALCQSRVCGPVVDIAEQVRDERGDDAAFIHMEIFKNNEFSVKPQDLRPQVQAYNLPTEPWLFVVGANGKVSTAIEGAFSARELNEALDKLSG